VHVELPRRLAVACRTAGVRHLLQVSALGVPDPGQPAPSNYLRSKAAGEQALRDGLQGSATALSLLRPSVIFGAEDRFLNLFARLQAVLPVMALAGAGARFQPVWVEDVAEAMVRCLRGETGALPPPVPGATWRLECAGPQVWTLGELVRAAGRWSGHARPVLPLPEWAGLLQASLLGWLPGEPLMSPDNLRSMRVPNVATPGRPGLAELGIAPSGVADVMTAHLAR
jgi:NADH dehydrogenase